MDYKYFYSCGQCGDQFAAKRQHPADVLCPSCGANEAEYDKYDIRTLADDQYPIVSFGGEDYVGDEPTPEQKVALFRKWKLDHQGKTWADFAASIIPFDYGAIGVQWCGMWLGIEKDGYTHS